VSASSTPAPAPVAKKPAAVESDSFDDMFGDDEEVKPVKADVNAVFDEDEGDNEEEKAANRGLTEKQMIEICVFIFPSFSQSDVYIREMCQSWYYDSFTNQIINLWLSCICLYTDQYFSSIYHIMYSFDISSLSSS
jgi:hypothetical protein